MIKTHCFRTWQNDLLTLVLFFFLVCKCALTCDNVLQTKVSTSRSNSMVSFDEALREAEANRKSPATTPTINEERPS